MRRFFTRLINLAGTDAEIEMNREMAAHLALIEEDLEQRGMSPEEARLGARRAYGSMAHAQELHREARSFLWVEQFAKDILYGIRVLLHNPGFSAMAILSLALAIGANTVIFSLINTTLLQPLDYKEPDRLVAIRMVSAANAAQTGPVNFWSYLAWRKRAKSFESMGEFFTFESSVARDGNGAPAERIAGQYVSPSLFATLGVAPALGRTFNEVEGAPITFARIALISDSLWERRYGRDPRIVGRTMDLDGVKTEIVGVMPKDFSLFVDGTDYWAASGITRQRLESNGGRLNVIARLKHGAGIAQAQAEMDGITAQLAKQDPSRGDNSGARVQPLQDAFMGSYRNPLLLLQGAVVFVLLIACANVAGLLLARGASRQTEVAVRTAVGAGRWRIIRQLLTESTVLAVAGGVVGIALAWGGLRLFVASAPAGFPRLNELRIDMPVLGFTAGIALITGILFGLAPAMQLARPDLIEVLKAATRGSGTAIVRQRFRASLVTLQVALALMLLIGAGLTINSFLRIEANDLGMDPHGLLEFQFRYPALQVLKPVGRYRNSGVYDVDPNVALTVERMVERLRRNPEAVSVAASSGSIGSAMAMNFRVAGESSRGHNAGAPLSNVGAPLHNALYLGVTPHYFGAMVTPILRGRDFTERDTPSASHVAIINESMAKLYWPGKSPLGQHILIDYLPNDPPREIVGVVGDVRLSRTQQDVRPMMYVPLAQQGAQWIGPQLGARSGGYFAVRVRPDVRNPLSLTQEVRREMAEIDPSQPIANIQTVEETLSGQVQFTRLYMLLLGVFGGAAAILAAVGIYGVMSFSIAQRRREIGIRMALGANHREVLHLVGRQALSMIGLGLMLGLAGALALTRLLEFALWNVRPSDPLTFAAVSVFLALIALVACIVPTRQATRVDPAVAVRAE
ncbi:MAG TPA: ABC transporter permease [Bryobacteraceae bacterium]|jgi:putative ABC transport system permease protein|nr:ABC transporter permease [Bryobacteraceae bacterium]